MRYQGVTVTWSDEKDEILRRDYTNLGRRALGVRLGLSPACVGRRAKKLGLTRTPGGHQPASSPCPDAAARAAPTLEDRIATERAILSLRRRGDFVWTDRDLYIVNCRERLSATQLVARAARAAERDRLLAHS